MRALSQAECLALWESGQTLHPLDRGLLAVHAAFPESRRESVADWPLGRRNRALAQMRSANFGRWIRGWTACEQCGDKLEFEVDGSALANVDESCYETPVHANGREFRLPTSRDLARIVDEPDPSSAAIRILEHCQVSGPSDGPLSQWSEEEVDLIGESMAAADPMAEILLHFDCPACDHSFDQALDLIAFLWSEMEGRAKRLLLDVHALASTYGWSEAEILSLSSARRDFYLEMVRA